MREGLYHEVQTANWAPRGYQPYRGSVILKLFWEAKMFSEGLGISNWTLDSELALRVFLAFSGFAPDLAWEMPNNTPGTLN